jgi:hypothetical protein
VSTKEIVDSVLEGIGAFALGWFVGWVVARVIRAIRKNLRKPSPRRTP